MTTDTGEIADLTRSLVAIPSHEAETAAGDFLVEWLRENTDATITRDDHGNVIARRGTGDTSLALVGHHDVVAPAERQQENGEYVVGRRDGRLYGRGTADMKGAVAAMLCAFRDAELDRAESDDASITTSLADELVFVSFVGEEIGGVGARGAIEDGFVPDYALVGEGSTGYSISGVVDIAVAHKGRRGSTLEVSGTAAHASEPAAGENAIYRASDAIDAVRELSFPETTVMGETVRGSIAVTEIAGGTAWNVIPDACSVTIDERTVPGDRADLAGIAELPGVTWTVDQDLPPMACDDEAFADLVLAASTDVHPKAIPAEAGQAEDSPGQPQHVVKPHATDAGWLADAGTTCLVCGPAEPGEAHTADESVSIAILERCHRIYKTVAERALNGQPTV